MTLEKLSTRKAVSRVLALVVLGCWPAAGRAVDLESARRLELSGNYAEAAEQYAELAEEEPAGSALGLARIDVAQGRRAAAIDRLRVLTGTHPQVAAASSALARLAFDRGDWETARTSSEAALKIDPQDLSARLVQAELFESAGELEQANQGYKWLVDYYNEHEVGDPEQLRAIGRAAAQYARWNRLTDQFRFLINELYPDALKEESKYWPAHLECGKLFLEKYNEAEATREFTSALKLNPQAAEVYAALAHLALARYDIEAARSACQRALEIDPELLSAWHAKADLAMANFDAPGALGIVEGARKLNPRSEETLARIAAVYVIIDGAAAIDGEGRLASLLTEVNAQNPRAGLFYHTLAVRLEERRQFAAAERFFREALERMPMLVGPQAGLGMMFMRLGREEEAKKLLDAAFETDPFNIRVKNTLEVLDVLAGYETHETEHFRIKYDPAKDKLLARYMGRELERAFPDLCQQFGFTPPEKSLFEIFSQARNTNGHGWFSARMVGLPYVGTVGACAGKMVALASPNDTQSKYNWARVVKHEFVHVINLQQTNYNVPHWFTEALAVINEGYPRSEVWNRLLLERVPAGNAFTLDTINLGFIRPESGADWQLAYCQAELYAEYLRERFGADSISKLLAAFAENQNTSVAIERALGIPQAEFEAGYQQYLKKIVADLRSHSAPVERKLADLERAVRADPKNPELLAQLAYAQLGRAAYPLARQYARQALAIEPRQQLAAYVVARLHLLIGENNEALAVLQAALDEKAPQENLLLLLAGLRLKAEDYQEAARIYRLAVDRDPENPRWRKLLARVYLVAGQKDPLRDELTKLAELDADDFTVRKKLAQMALQAEDLPAASHWGRQALEIDVQDAEVHALLGQVLAGQKLLADSIEEYEVALELVPANHGWQLALADTLIQAGQKDRAREVLKQLLSADPDYPGADLLWESLEP